MVDTRRVMPKPDAFDALQWTGANAIDMMHFTGRDSFIVEPGYILVLDGYQALFKGDWLIKRGTSLVRCKRAVFKDEYVLIG